MLKRLVMESIQSSSQSPWGLDLSKTLSSTLHENDITLASIKRKRSHLNVTKLEEGRQVQAKARPANDNLKRVDIVYTRRSQRNFTGKEAMITTEQVVEGVQDDTHNLSTPGSAKLGEIAECNDLLPSSKKEGRKVTITESSSELKMSFTVHQRPWTLLVHKKLQPEWIAYDPMTMRPGSLSNSMASFKLLSWNVNGLRALLRRTSGIQGNPILDLAQREEFDFLCLQETKIQEKDALLIKDSLLPGYDTFWNCSMSKLGYSGTAVFSRAKPLSVSYGLGIPTHDGEGRLITTEFDSFYVVSGYIPNSGQKLERLVYRTKEWDRSLGSFLKELEKTKPVILTGDLNCAHEEIDIYNPDGNRRHAGFTDEERCSFEENFLKRGMVDTFRLKHPQAVAYTYWGYRTAARPKNQGWRLDYFLASEQIVGHVHDSYILPDICGSDHCPVGLIVKI